MDIKAMNRRVIEEFRSGGEVGGMDREGILLLTTTGARSGRPYTTPLMFHRDGDRLLLIASHMGSPRHPDWYHNLTAHPRVTVEVDGPAGYESFEAEAVPAVGAERERLWAMIKELYPFFVDHEARTDRVIPVVVVTRSRPSGDGDRRVGPA